MKYLISNSSLTKRRIFIMPSTKKSVLITGCSAGGIGHALAQAFQKQGLTAFAAARNVSKMDGLASLPNVNLLALDVTSKEYVASALVQVSRATGGRLDYLVNNTGQLGYMPALNEYLDDPEAVARCIFEVNFWSVLRMIQAFTPLLMEAGGTAVNVGSLNAIVHPSICAVYNATKAAVHSLGETLRLQASADIPRQHVRRHGAPQQDGRRGVCAKGSR
jgi:1-acylglycerone phosphate reductase